MSNMKIIKKIKHNPAYVQNKSVSCESKLPIYSRNIEKVYPISNNKGSRDFKILMHKKAILKKVRYRGRMYLKVSMKLDAPPVDANRITLLARGFDFSLAHYPLHNSLKTIFGLF